MAKRKKRTLVLNLFGGAGAGKSTLLFGLVWLFKILGVCVEPAIEFPKGLTWEKRHITLKRQIYIFGKHTKVLENLDGNVDLIVSDGPVINSILYLNPKEKCAKEIRKLVIAYHNQYNNINVFVERGDLPFEKEGRVQANLEQAEAQGQLFRQQLDELGISYYVVTSRKGIIDAVKLLVEVAALVLKHYKRNNSKKEMQMVSAEEIIRELKKL